MNIQNILIKIILAITLLVGSAFYGYKQGVSYQKLLYIEEQSKANSKVEQKNASLQVVADKEAVVQVIYKDRIVVKYQEVIKEVIKYEKTEAANVYLDPVFIRLHDNAASANEQIPIAEPASRANQPNDELGVTTGQAIAIITRNYEQFYLCKSKVDGWVRFYSELQKSVSD